MIRVAAAQFAVTNNVEDNLATCVRMLKEAAKCKPDLIVLPEFVNHNSWYDDQDHCYKVSVDLDGDFLTTIINTVKDINAYVVINCTVRRSGNHVTGTSLTYAPDGKLLGENNKQVLVGHENDFLDIATEEGPILDTPVGKLAMYSCMDGVINETPRCLSLRGAEILCNSLNSFARDEGDLHIPVRAAENKVFVVAANKVGPLIPQEILAPISEAINIPMEFLCGAGDSQIVAPDGTVLAVAGKEEEVIWADIDPSLANDKSRPDGTNVFTSRKPELYQVLGEDPANQPLPEFKGAIDVNAAAVSITTENQQAIDQAITAIKTLANEDVSLICLPELFWLNESDKLSLANNHASNQQTQSINVIEAIQKACSNDQLVATSIIKNIDGKPCHCGVVIDKNGVQLTQPQIHFSERFAWSALGNKVNTYTSVHGVISISLEDDAIYPETYRLISMQGCEVVFAPLAQQEQWQSTTGLLERASENRVNVIAADRNSANNVICPVQKEFTIMTPWKERQFDGLLSATEVVNGDKDNPITRATVHPQASHNKECSHRTHLINNRPWKLMQSML